MVNCWEFLVYLLPISENSNNYRDETHSNVQIKTASALL